METLQRTSILNLIDDESQWKKSNRDIEEDEQLTEAQKTLLLKIRTQFDPV